MKSRLLVGLALLDPASGYRAALPLPRPQLRPPPARFARVAAAPVALHPAGPFAAALAPGVAPLAWDVGSAVFSLLITLAWLKSVSLATQAGALAPNFSRKLVHSTCGTGFMLLWCIYSDAPSARLLAAVVPALQLVRLWLAGSSTEDASASELVSTLSRTGKRKEALGGPFLCAARATRRNSFGAILCPPLTRYFLASQVHVGAPRRDAPRLPLGRRRRRRVPDGRRRRRR